MTEEQKSRMERMKALQTELDNLGAEMVQEWLDAQKELMRLCQELVDARSVIPAGIAEKARTMLPELQSHYETAGQVAHKALPTIAQRYNNDVAKAS